MNVNVSASGSRSTGKLPLVIAPSTCPAEASCDKRRLHIGMQDDTGHARIHPGGHHPLGQALLDHPVVGQHPPKRLPPEVFEAAVLLSRHLRPDAVKLRHVDRATEIRPALFQSGQRRPQRAVHHRQELPQRLVEVE